MLALCSASLSSRVATAWPSTIAAVLLLALLSLFVLGPLISWDTAPGAPGSPAVWTTQQKWGREWPTPTMPSSQPQSGSLPDCTLDGPWQAHQWNHLGARHPTTPSQHDTNRWGGGDFSLSARTQLGARPNRRRAGVQTSVPIALLRLVTTAREQLETCSVTEWAHAALLNPIRRVQHELGPTVPLGLSYAAESSDLDNLFKGGGYLPSSVLNHLCHRMAVDQSDLLQRPPVLAWDSNFYSAFVRSGDQHYLCLRTFADIPRRGVWLLPVHLQARGGEHFVLAAVDWSAQELSVRDSLAASFGHTHYTIFGNLRRLVSLVDTTSTQWTESSPTVPQQHGADCGLHLLVNYATAIRPDLD